MRRSRFGVLAATLFLCALSSTLAKEDTATVVRVIDGDTIEVDVAGAVEKVRLIGVDTPEIVDPRKPVEFFGKEASEFTRKLVEGKKVVLRDELGGQDRDKYGRLLRYVYLEDGTFVNAEIVKQGMERILHYSTEYAPICRTNCAIAATGSERNRSGNRLKSSLPNL